MRTVEPVEVEVPLGLDDPAPILVWRHGAKITRPSRTNSMAVFTSEEAALEFIDYWGDWFTKPEPCRIPLEDALKITRMRGHDSLRLFDENLRIIEEYPV